MHDDGEGYVRLNVHLLTGPGLHITMDDYRAAVIDYLRRVRDESGRSLNEIANSVGVSHTTLTRPVNNPNYKYIPKVETLQRIAQLTGIPLPSGLPNVGISTLTTLPIRALTVRGVVAAGMWQAAELLQDEPLGTAPMVEDPRYNGLPQWAELLRGPSMNRTYLDGEYLHVIDWPALGYSPRVGLDVIVERRSAQDGKVERTCKRIASVNGALALVGDSTVDVWNQPLPLEDGEDGLVQILGLVVGSYRPRPA